jgi:transcriptional regulator with XRE-family HTH domain
VQLPVARGLAVPTPDTPRFAITIRKVSLLRTLNLRSAVCVVKYRKYRYSELVEFGGKSIVATALGEKIRILRKKEGYTLERLAELTDSSKSYIWELENKNPPRPSAEKIARIASVLGVTSDYLLNPAETQLVDATDEAFFRKYRNMDPITKNKIRRMIDVWGEEK